MTDTDDFDQGAAVRARLDAEALIVDVDGFEGPLDLLLALSRTQKVDLRKVSVLQLAEQYLRLHRPGPRAADRTGRRLSGDGGLAGVPEIAPAAAAGPRDEGPSGEDLAAHLAFQLERLEAMREVSARLMGRDQKGRDFFVRGVPEDVTLHRRVSYSATLLDLMQAYARIRTRDEFRPLSPWTATTSTRWTRRWSGCAG